MIFKGKDISGKKPYDLASLGIGRTFQVVKPFPGLTVLQNTTIASFCKYPKMADAENHAWEILEFTGLAEHAKKYASDLTLGGRKKLEISKALALEPELLLLDEVMAGLNPTEADITVELIHRLKNRGISILIVEHIMRVMMNLSDRIVVLNFGQQIAEGTPGEIAENPDVITAYLGEDIE